jgi:8-oxo-dGTP pyrophosphatase MutT (NUDIX family)
MTPRAQATLELGRYASLFRSDAPLIAELAKQLAEDKEDILSRKNMWGHITTSAFILDVTARKTLLIHHKQHNQWLPPGGHFEGFETLLAAAIREALEETGVVNPAPHAWTAKYQCPFDIDSHPIGANAKKNEGPHVHHDFIYLLTADSRTPLVHQEEEVDDAKWFLLDELEVFKSVRLARILRKLHEQGILR